jgi:hypothetical protein
MWKIMEEPKYALPVIYQIGGHINYVPVSVNYSVIIVYSSSSYPQVCELYYRFRSTAH